MASSLLAFAPQRQGPLAFLPRGTLVEYQKNDVIYSQVQPGVGIYLVLDGRVKVSRSTLGGREVVVEIYGAGDFFGEATLLGFQPDSEEATALEDTKVTVWPVTLVEDLVAAEPRLAAALWRILVERTLSLEDRIESMAHDHVECRLARTLLGFAEWFGKAGDHGAVHMPGLTHYLLAHYVGTSREIVSHDMSEFRAQGLIRYTRKTITVYPLALQQWLQQR